MLSLVAKYLLISSIIFIGVHESFALRIIKRNEWGARSPTDKVHIPGKLPYVIIHHSAIPEACFTTDDCKQAMRDMQRLHQDVNKWADIGYSFAIGGDGNIYEGRGFKIVGAHAPGFNNKSVGICLIGNWSDRTPPSVMLEATWKLIKFGKSNGFIENDFVIHGHRQAVPTECPGNALYNQITKWPHFGNVVD